MVFFPGILTRSMDKILFNFELSAGLKSDWLSCHICLADDNIQRESRNLA